jgi:hypothetical protein
MQTNRAEKHAAWQIVAREVLNSVLRHHLGFVFFRIPA